MVIGDLLAILKVGLATFTERSGSANALNLRRVKKQRENTVFSSVMDTIVTLQANG